MSPVMPAGIRTVTVLAAVLLAAISIEAMLSWLDGERVTGGRELAKEIRLPEATMVKSIENHSRQLGIQLHTGLQ